MPIRRYLKPGAAFTPETLETMGQAFRGAVDALNLGDDEMRREAVAEFVIQLARWHGNLDAVDLRDRTIAALRNLKPSTNGKPNADRT